MTLRRFMPLVAMAFLWTGSQIPLYLFGGVPPLSPPPALARKTSLADRLQSTPTSEASTAGSGLCSPTCWR